MVVKNNVQAKLELNWNPLMFSSREIFKQLKNNMKSKNHKRVCGDTAKLKPQKNTSLVPNEYDKSRFVNPD